MIKSACNLIIIEIKMKLLNVHETDCIKINMKGIVIY